MIYLINGLNQATSVDSDPISYDDRGNITSWNGQSFTYDAENFMTSGNGATLSYDAAGRLLKTEKAGMLTSELLYSGSVPISWYKDNGTNISSRWVPGPGTDEIVAYFGSTTTTNPNYMVHDEKGSIIAMTRHDGSIMKTNTYDAYGKPAADNGWWYQYTGQLYIPHVEMYYYKARWYNAELGASCRPTPVRRQRISESTY